MAMENTVHDMDDGAIDMTHERRAMRRARPRPGRAALTISAFCLGIACAAAVLTVIYHEEAGLAGLALLIGLTVTGLGVLATLAMRRPDASARERRSRVLASMFDGFTEPLVVTQADGSVVFANISYRELCGAGGSALPPELAIRPDADMAGRLYRLSRMVSEGGRGSADIRTTEGGVARWRRVTVEGMARGRAEQRLNMWRISTLADVRSGGMEEGEAAVIPFAREHAGPAVATGEAGLFADLFTAAPVAMAVLDEAGAIETANEAFAHFLKVENAAELTGRVVSDLVSADDRGGLRRIVSLATETDGGGAIEAQFENAGPARIHALPVRTQTGKPRKAALHVTDLTTLRSIETQFLQAQKMQAVDKLAGGIAHDFNNILLAMIGFADILLLRHKPGDPSFGQLMQIKNAGLRGARLVQHLLSFSRQQTLTPKVYKAADLIYDVSEMLKRLLTERLTLVHDFGRELWSIRVDQAQFENMIINLGVNARDAMRDGGTLTIRTRNISEADSRQQGHDLLTPGEYVLIEVSDTGTGIPAELMEKVFQPFFTTKPQGEGTGLGLASVYGFVKQSGGFLFPRSEVGQGTTFGIYLPRHHEDEAVEAASTRKQADPVITEEKPEARGDAAPRDLTGAGTVLLVEDDDQVRSLTALVLEMRGYEVLKASDGEEALEIARDFQKPIHLMVSDVVMPGMDGPEVARIMRSVRKDMKVLFMSGYAEADFRKQVEMDENVHFISKPFPNNELAAKVKDVLSSGG